MEKMHWCARHVRPSVSSSFRWRENALSVTHVLQWVMSYIFFILIESCTLTSLVNSPSPQTQANIYRTYGRKYKIWFAGSLAVFNTSPLKIYETWRVPEAFGERIAVDLEFRDLWIDRNTEIKDCWIYLHINENRVHLLSVNRVARIFLLLWPANYRIPELMSTNINVVNSQAILHSLNLSFIEKL
jgi:hypothetical protein